MYLFKQQRLVNILLYNIFIQMCLYHKVQIIVTWIHHYELCVIGIYSQSHINARNVVFYNFEL